MMTLGFYICILLHSTSPSMYICSLTRYQLDKQTSLSSRVLGPSLPLPNHASDSPYDSFSVCRSYQYAWALKHTVLIVLTRNSSFEEVRKRELYLAPQQLPNSRKVVSRLSGPHWIFRSGVFEEMGTSPSAL